jgi:hypothetical protein
MKKGFWDFESDLARYAFWTAVLVGIPKVIVIKKKSNDKDDQA